MKIKNRLVFSLTVASVFATQSLVHAQVEKKSTNLGKKEGVVAQANASQRVYVNPETGKIEAAPEELAGAESEGVNSGGVNRSLNLSGVASEPRLLPDGSRMIDFNGQFMTPVRAKINSNGDAEVGHEVGHDHKQDK